MLRREMEDHMKDNGALHLKQLQATVEVRLALPFTIGCHDVKGST
jgi:hypothetical protein